MCTVHRLCWVFVICLYNEWIKFSVLLYHTVLRPRHIEVLKNECEKKKQREESSIITPSPSLPAAAGNAACFSCQATQLMAPLKKLLRKENKSRTMEPTPLSPSFSERKHQFTSPALQCTGTHTPAHISGEQWVCQDNAEHLHHWQHYNKYKLHLFCLVSGIAAWSQRHALLSDNYTLLHHPWVSNFGGSC